MQPWTRLGVGGVLEASVGQHVLVDLHVGMTTHKHLQQLPGHAWRCFLWVCLQRLRRVLHGLGTGLG